MNTFSNENSIFKSEKIKIEIEIKGLLKKIISYEKK